MKIWAGSCMAVTRTGNTSPHGRSSSGVLDVGRESDGEGELGLGWPSGAGGDVGVPCSGSSDMSLSTI